MFSKIHKVLDRAIALDDSKAFVFAVDDEVKQLIIDLNTKKQLGLEGIDSDGDSLGEYAPFTVQKKLTEGIGTGKIVDHITFYDTGDYWKSWRVDVNGQFILITVDRNKFRELVEDLNFAPEHVGLTRENMNLLTKVLIQRYQKYVKLRLAV